MALKVGGTEVITNARQLSNIASVDATTVAALGTAGVGGGGGSADFVATGTIPNGATVGLKTDGTIEVIANTPSNTPSTLDNSSITDTNYIQAADIVYCSGSDRYVIAYQDGNNNYLKTVVAQLVNGAFVFGSVQTRASISTYIPKKQALSYDVTRDKVLLMYGETGSGQVYVKCLSVDTSTNSCTQTSSLQVNTNGPDANGFCIVYEPNSGKHVVFWNGSGCKAVALTVASGGSSISKGSDLTVKSGNWEHISATVDTDNNKVIFVYNNANNNIGSAVIISISGTTLSAGTLTDINSGNKFTYTSCAYDSGNSKIVVAFTEPNNSNYSFVKVGSISGSTFSFGSNVTIQSDTTFEKSIVYDPDTSRVSIAFRDGGNDNKIKVIFGTISGTSISLQAETTIDEDESTGTFIAQAYDTAADKFAVIYRSDTDSKIGYTVYSGATTNVNSWIGMAAEAISNGSSGEVTIIGGVNEGQSSLTIGSTYYVREDGSLQTGSTTVKAGRAIATTKILVTEGNAS